MAAPSRGRVGVKTTCHFQLSRLNLSQLAKQAKKRYTCVKRSLILDFPKLKPLFFIQTILLALLCAKIRCAEISRHIDIIEYFVRELVLAGSVKLMPLRTRKMVADALTKSLLTPAFVRHRQIMTGVASYATRLLG